ncbi:MULTISPECIES: DUF6318 family protein [unclassified Aeromicrobium]|uniref:DUF6318 family protein n=1 Tax=unclassified Aeromicrobium TaxID=2633570 RepID=UPI00396B08C1
MRLVTSAVLATLALTLSACGGDDPPPPEPSTTATTRETPSVPRPPDLPALASEKTATGASAFVGHYVQLLDFAALTGRVTELERLSEPDCKGCWYYIDLFERIHSSGGSVIGRRWTNSESTIHMHSSPPIKAKVRTKLRVTAGKIQMAAGEPLNTHGSFSRPIELSLRNDGRWHVLAISSGHSN